MDIRFEDAGDFGSTYSTVRHHGYYGYIRQDGSWAIRPGFEHAREFSRVLAPVCLAGKWGIYR
ncbi:MAG: WG repeat-containing protein [Lewinellaceae bacterium]|nr:WG repeat-containing protein [Lewinellaceae bacterium]